MTLSAGLFLVLLTFGVLLIRAKWVRLYSIVALLFAIFYQLLLSTEPASTWKWMGFLIQLYQFRPLSQWLAYAFLLYGIISFVFLWPENKGRFFSFFALFHIGCSTAILFAGDLFSFFLLWECICLSAFCLLLLESCWDEAKTYLVYHLFGSISLLIGIGINYQVTGGIHLPPEAGQLFFLIAILVKGGVFPFHSWLLRVYPQLKPGLTVFLSAYTTKAGLFSLTILLSGIDLQLFGGLIAVIAVVYALKQHSLMRLLSFHLLSQMGYVIVAFGIHSLLGDIGGIYHLINNILYKGLLFMVAATLIQTFKTDDLTVLKGRGKQIPLLFIVTLIASLAIAGVPLFNGYISKLLIKKSLQSATVGFLLSLAGVGTALSFLKVVYYGFVSKTEEPGQNISLDKSVRFSLIALAVLCLIAGNFSQVIVSLYPDPLPLYSLSSLWAGIWPILLACFLFKRFYVQINHWLVTHLSDFRADWNPVIRLGNTGLKQLRSLHTGNVQHYLIWLITVLAFFWTYLLWNH